MEANNKGAEGQTKKTVVFDELAEHFSEKIYRSQKGRLRLALVERGVLDFLATLPVTREMRQQQTIVDVGGGLGQMSVLLADLGYQVIYCDHAESMLAKAKVYVSKQPEHIAARIRFVHAELENIAEYISEPIAGVLFHAVLEWLPVPRVGLQQVMNLLQPGSFLSLLYYNRNALVFKNLIRGNFRKVESGDFAGEPGSLTPCSPLDPIEVASWLTEMRLDIQQHQGIRCFYDYMPRTLERSDEDILRLEASLGSEPTYRNLARYQLVQGIMI